MTLAKRLGRSMVLRSALCWLTAWYIRLVFRTGRWEVEGAEIPAGYWDRGEPFILAFWHGRLLLMPTIWRPGVPIHMLISQHRDGQLIARTVEHLGISTVAGSSSRGGAAAVRGLVRLLKGGACVGITPDGPRGPRMHAGSGVISLAKLSGCAILPAAFAARRRTLLGSWDRFMVALPFTRGVFVWDQPMTVPRDTSDAQVEALRAELESRLTAITMDADRRTGNVPVEPAPRPGGAA